jgi:thiaminase
MQFTDFYENVVGDAAKYMLKFPWDNKRAYAGFLAQTYFYVRHSTRLLTLAASRFSMDENELHRRFIQHSEEERGHEFMCQKDMARIGYELKTFNEQTATAAFYQRQYYLIEHVDPICFLGYIIFLEGLAVKAGQAIKGRVQTEHTQKAGLFVSSHSEDDQEHIVNAFKALDGLASERMNLIRENMEMSAKLYKNMMAEALTEALLDQRRSDPRAA